MATEYRCARITRNGTAILFQTVDGGGLAIQSCGREIGRAGSINKDASITQTGDSVRDSRLSSPVIQSLMVESLLQTRGSSVLMLYARGLSTRELQAFLEERY